MMRSFLFLTIILAVVAAFSPTPRFGVFRMQRNMFSTDDPSPTVESKALDVVVEGESSAGGDSISPAGRDPNKMVVKNLARGGEVREVNFIDPAMSANTNPLEMNWWAYPLLGFPFVLLANDFLHFLPSEGPLAFLSKY